MTPRERRWAAVRRVAAAGALVVGFAFFGGVLLGALAVMMGALLASIAVQLVVDGEPSEPPGVLVPGQRVARPSTLPGGPAAMTTHVGPYEAMEPAYAALASWVDDQGGEPTGDAWEIYFSDPQQQPDPSGWRTEIVQPYRLR